MAARGKGKAGGLGKGEGIDKYGVGATEGAQGVKRSAGNTVSTIVVTTHGAGGRRKYLGRPDCPPIGL